MKPGRRGIATMRMNLRSLLASTILATVSAMVVMPTASVAVGLGANFGYSYRTATLQQGDFVSSVVSGYPFSVDWSSNDLRVGFTLDTAVARDRLFNYRLNLNYQRSWITVSALPQTFNYDGGEMENIFGFGVVRRPDLRWWVGPGLRFSGGSDPITIITPTQFSSFSASQIEAGVGIVTGVNLHRGDRISAGLTAGYYINWALFQINDGAADEPQYTGPMHRVSVGLTLLYRLGSDSF